MLKPQTNIDAGKVLFVPNPLVKTIPFVIRFLEILRYCKNFDAGKVFAPNSLEAASPAESSPSALVVRERGGE